MEKNGEKKCIQLEYEKYFLNLSWHSISNRHGEKRAEVCEYFKSSNLARCQKVQGIFFFKF